MSGPEVSGLSDLLDEEIDKIIGGADNIKEIKEELIELLDGVAMNLRNGDYDPK